MTDIFLGLGEFFKWTFGLLEFGGYFMSWLLAIAGMLWLLYFILKIRSFGQEDRRYKGDFK